MWSVWTRNQVKFNLNLLCGNYNNNRVYVQIENFPVFYSFFNKYLGTMYLVYCVGTPVKKRASWLAACALCSPSR